MVRCLCSAAAAALLLAGGIAPSEAEAGYGIDHYYHTPAHRSVGLRPDAASTPVFVRTVPHYNVDHHEHNVSGDRRGGWSVRVIQSNWHPNYPRYGADYHPYHSHRNGR